MPRPSCPLAEREVEFLLGELCVKLGFCLDPSSWQKLVEHPPETIEEFAKAVIEADGLTLPSEHQSSVEAVVQKYWYRRKYNGKPFGQ
jgi:hypothetical protein